MWETLCDAFKLMIVAALLLERGLAEHGDKTNQVKLPSYIPVKDLTFPIWFKCTELSCAKEAS